MTSGAIPSRGGAHGTATFTRVSEFRAGFARWLDASDRELDAFRAGDETESLEAEVDRQAGLMRRLYEAGWSRHGWPVACGGLGGSEVFRAVLYDELSAAGIVLPEVFVLLETVGPPLVHYAPHLAARHLPAYLRGAERWGQGFSESEAGSDLASVRTRATPTASGFLVSGQKIWMTLGQCAQWAIVLCRTGSGESRHRGLTMLWIDLQSVGVTVRPIRAANGRNEFAEVFFSDVAVPAEYVIGAVDGGWEVAMYLLQFERGMYAWERQAALHRVLRDAAASGRLADYKPALGHVYTQLRALRARSGATVTRLAAGETLGPEASVDKLLLSRAEQSVQDLLRDADRDSFVLGNDGVAARSREEWFYSRATSIFGGAADVQRDIIAQRMLALPRGGNRGRR